MNYYRVSPELTISQLLLRLAEQCQTGCLQLSDGQITWSILLNQGRLFYATNSVDPFERFDHHLRKLRPQIPTLVSAIRDQMQTLFEPFDDNLCKDYQAIHWLVKQNYFAFAHAALLVEKLSEEVIRSLLTVQTGDAVLLPFDPVSFPAVFCNLDLPWLIEFCQTCFEQPQPQQLTAVSPLSGRLSQSRAPRETFTPLAKPAVGAVDAEAPITVLPSLSQSQQIFSILCIEPTKTTLNPSKLLLDDEFFSVAVVKDLLEALLQLTVRQPDLILLDASQLKDAYRLCSLLHGYPDFQRLPIIAVTNRSGWLDRLQARLAGATDYLVQPLTRPQLIKMLFKHLA